MDAGALDEIHRFTASVEKPDLYVYLDIDPESDRDTIAPPSRFDEAGLRVSRPILSIAKRHCGSSRISA